MTANPETIIEPGNAAGSSVDPAEVARFNRLAADWWNPNGRMKPLHRINPLRLGYIRDHIARHFARNAEALDGLKGLDIIDIGCGAGLLSEPLARLGGSVTGIDAAATNIEVARLHAKKSGIAVAYECATAEAVAATERTFDVVLAMEIIEHVVDPAAFFSTCASLVKPGGILLVSTLNRTLKAYALAIVGAEYVLRWLPRGTHQWDKFVRPVEMERFARSAGLATIDRSGLVYNPLIDEWRLAPRDLDVNYMVLFGRG